MKVLTDIRIKEKQTKFNNDKKEGKLKNKIREISYSEYDDILPYILLKEEKTFFSELESNIKQSFSFYYCEKNLIDKDIISYIEYYLKSIRKYYTEDKKLTNNAISDYAKNNKLFKQMTNYFHHCNDENSNAIHTCGGKMIEIAKDKEIIFVFCADCKQVYTKDCIKLACNSCNQHFYTRIKNENECKEEDYLPATWEKYHCNTIIKDAMKCVTCNEVYLYSKKTNLLKCKKCKIEVNPLSIAWKCTICRDEFKCKAKHYCNVEFKTVKDCIKKALIQFSLAKPKSIGCCNLNINTTEFKHNKDCNGLLINGELFGNKILVCEKCLSINFAVKFIWTCPNCFFKFRDKEIVINNKISTPVKVNNDKNEKDDKGNLKHNKSMNYLNVQSNSEKKTRNLMDILKERNEGFQGLSRNSSNLILNVNAFNQTQVDFKSKINNQNNVFAEDEVKEEAKMIDKNCKKSSNFMMEEDKHIDSDEFKSDKSVDSLDINKYKIIQQIGEGTYGKIYKVSDKNNKTYALKKIICHDKNELKFTKDEFNIAIKHPHNNIVRIIGMNEKCLDETTYALYILIELAQSDWEKEVSLRSKYLKFYKENELLSILYQLVSCLSYLQKNKISHRDLKPQNILIFDSKIYKLADFGEAKQHKSYSNMSTLRGTELYMSPILFGKLRKEIESNKNSSEPKGVLHNVYKSDVFSLGYCMIYASTLTFDSIVSMREVNTNQENEKILRNWIKNRYSETYIKILLKMIDLEEVNRPDFSELFKMLEKLKIN